MKHLRILAVALLTLGMGSAAMAAAPTYYDTTYTSAQGSMNYRVYLPADYDPNGAAIPVVLYLNSAAERGDYVSDIFQSYNNWTPELVAETQTGTHQAILVMPQSGWGQTWATVNNGDNWYAGNYTDATQGTINPRLQLAIDIVNLVSSTKNADTNRLYITGPSMGGYGTWDAISRYPNLFAAAAPLAGGGNLTAASTRLADLPIWMGHGVSDPLITVANDDAMYAALVAAGGDPIYSRIAGGDHGDWWDEFYTSDYYTVNSASTYAGSGTGFYDWLFAQTLAPEPTSFAVISIVGGVMGLSRRRRQAVTA